VLDADAGGSGNHQGRGRGAGDAVTDDRDILDRAATTVDLECVKLDRGNEVVVDYLSTARSLEQHDAAPARWPGACNVAEQVAGNQEPIARTNHRARLGEHARTIGHI